MQLVFEGVLSTVQQTQAKLLHLCLAGPPSPSQCTDTARHRPPHLRWVDIWPHETRGSCCQQPQQSGRWSCEIRKSCYQGTSSQRALASAQISAPSWSGQGAPDAELLSPGTSWTVELKNTSARARLEVLRRARIGIAASLDWTVQSQASRHETRKKRQFVCLLCEPLLVVPWDMFAAQLKLGNPNRDMTSRIVQSLELGLPADSPGRNNVKAHHAVVQAGRFR